MEPAPPRRRFEEVVPLAFAFITLAVHLVANRGYGYFRDEFYYLACSDHLAAGYVDHPPLSILLLRLNHLVLVDLLSAGESLSVLRLLPALAGAAAIFVTGVLVREMGGGRREQAVACGAFLIAPLYLAIDNYYSMNSFDLLFWTLAALLVVRLVNSEGRRGWVPLGFVLGFGLLNKISVLWLGFGLFAGILLTPARRWLRSPGPWIAGAIAALIFSPHVVWQVRNGWPTIEFMRNATGSKMADVSIPGFFAGQILVMHPLNAPLWIAGLISLLFMKEGRRWRLVGIIYVAVLALLLLGGKSRAGYLGPAYPPLLAAGAVAFLRPASERRKWIAPAAVAIQIAGGAVLAPFALPVLPVETFIAYQKALGVSPSTEERKDVGPLPQQYADMFGWEEMVGAIGRVYQGLPDAERPHTAIYVQNYGEAGAVDFFGRAWGLPRAWSGHNNYWYWWRGGDGLTTVLILGGRREDHLRSFQSVEEAAIFDTSYAMPYERHLTIWIARGLKAPPAELWPLTKNFS